MLMADMTESERETVRRMNDCWFAEEGTQLLEIVDMLWCGWECDHAMALIRTPDGKVRLKVLGGTDHPDNRDPVGMLEKRIAAYQTAIEETRRFLGIARTALRLPHPEGWNCGSCGRHFHDEQAVCPACGAEAEG